MGDPGAGSYSPWWSAKSTCAAAESRVYTDVYPYIVHKVHSCTLHCRWQLLRLSLWQWLGRGTRRRRPPHDSHFTLHTTVHAQTRLLQVSPVCQPQLLFFLQTCRKTKNRSIDKDLPATVEAVAMTISDRSDCIVEKCRDWPMPVTAICTTIHKTAEDRVADVPHVPSIITDFLLQ